MTRTRQRDPSQRRWPPQYRQRPEGGYLQLALLSHYLVGGRIIRNEDSGGSSAGLLHGFANVGENGTVKVGRAGLLGVGTTDDIGACAM
jgi:hypothetical protein